MQTLQKLQYICRLKIRRKHWSQALHRLYVTRTCKLRTLHKPWIIRKYSKHYFPSKITNNLISTFWKFQLWLKRSDQTTAIRVLQLMLQFSQRDSLHKMVVHPWSFMCKRAKKAKFHLTYFYVYWLKIIQSTPPLRTSFQSGYHSLKMNK